MNQPRGSKLPSKEAKLAKRISIINFKGGVGKTTLAFHLGIGLAAFHDARILLVDMDHQSSLSITCLGPTRWEESVDESQTVDEVFRPFIQPSAIPGEEIIIKSPMTSDWFDGDGRRRNNNRMDIVPASLRLDDTEIELTASHQGNAILSEWNKRTLICRWIEESRIDDKYDYIIFDCPPATKIVSQNAIAASHGYIIPVVPEAVMERGAPHLRNMMRSGIDEKLKALASMGEARTTYVPDTELVGLVITRLQVANQSFTNDHSQHLSSLQRLWGDALIKPYVLQGTGVSAALSARRSVYDRNVPNWTQNIHRREIDTQFIGLTTTIKQRVDVL